MAVINQQKTLFAQSAQKPPRITVITPSLNQGRFLDAAIRSVLDQNYPDLEYFIFDGGSTDESLDIIRSHESKLAGWTSEKDSGQSDAINKGFARATGRLVAWLNSDDFYLPGALAHAAAAYNQQPDASFFFGRCLRTDEAGRRQGEYVSAPRLLFNRDALVYGLNFIAQPATFINREYLLQVGPLNPALKWGMDTDLWLRLSAAAEPLAIDKLLAASREYAQTKTSSGSFTRVEELRRIAEEHSGVAMTPGAVCYFLDTFLRVVKENPEVFPPEYQGDISRFWASTSALFARWGAAADGTPLQSGAMKPQTNVKGKMLKMLSVW